MVDGAAGSPTGSPTSSTSPSGTRTWSCPPVDNRLTLVTSDSSLVTGGREVVQARLVGHAVVVPDDTIAVPSYELGLSGDPAAGGLAAMWWHPHPRRARRGRFPGLATSPPVARLPVRRAHGGHVRTLRVRERGPGAALPPSDRPAGGARRRPNPATVTLLTWGDVPDPPAPRSGDPGTARGHRPTPVRAVTKSSSHPTLDRDVRITSLPYCPL